MSKTAAVLRGVLGRGGRRGRTLVRLAAALMVFPALLTGAVAQAQDCQVTLSAADAQAGDQFGYSVAVHNGIAVIGNLAGNGGRNGTAYVVNLAARTQLLALTEPEPDANAAFGFAVAISADHVVVSAPNHGPGVVYVFAATTGAILHELRGAGIVDGDHFGWSLALSGRQLLVGALNTRNGDGSAHIFDVVTGTELRRLVPRGAADVAANFGNAVAFDGTTAVVAAVNDEVKGGGRAGAVYVFDARSGRQRRRIAPIGEDRTFFGASVAMEGDTLAVGVPGDDERGPDAGALHIYDLRSGQLRQRLTLDDGQAGDLFGAPVALRGDIVAAHVRGTARLLNSGLVQVFDARSGERTATLPGNLRPADDAFGRALALDDEWLVAGAPRHVPLELKSGEIELFRVADLPGTPLVLQPEPTVTRLRYELTIPGLGTFVFERSIIGRIVAEAPLACLPPKSFRVVDLELRPEQSEPPITPVDGVSITLNEPGVVLRDGGAGSVVAPDGSFTQDVQVQLVGTVQYTLPGATGSFDLSRGPLLTFPIEGTLSAIGGPLRLDAVVPPASRPIDLGLGPLNPTFTVSGTVGAERIQPKFVEPVPSTTLKAKVTLDFTKDFADAVNFSGTFDRERPPRLGDSTQAVLRIGARRIDVDLTARGRSVKGAAAAIRLKVKSKSAKFKVSVRAAELRAALAAQPNEAGLPREVPWSLTLPDGWQIAGKLVLDGKTDLRTNGEGALTRATLSMVTRKP